MKLIGLTGGIASGKSLVESMLNKANIPVIDADALSREVTLANSPGLAKVISHFGNQYLLTDGSLDRKALGQLVFADKDARDALEQIVHPLIAQVTQERLAAYQNKGHEYCVYCAALIFEKNMQNGFDAVILVTCDESIQIERLMNRDKLTREEAALRLEAQMPLSEKRKKTTFQVDNSNAPADCAADLSRVWHAITGSVVTFAP